MPPQVLEMNEPAPTLRLGVVGGGIGGLALAVALTRLDVAHKIQVDIYEAAAKLTQVGAGITVWPRGWEILAALGLESSLAVHISPPQEIVKDGKSRIGFMYRKSDQPQDAFICDVMFRGGSLSFHRADVQQVFLAHIAPAIRVHLNKRLDSHHETDAQVDLFFKDGTRATCDLLVGADGINSVVRKGFLASMYKLTASEAAKQARPLWTGTMVYRSLIDSEVIKRQNPTHPCLTEPLMYCGKSKHVVSYPISGGKLINAIGFVSDPTKEGSLLEGPAVTNSTTEVVSSYFTNWSDEVKCIINNMQNPSRWAIETVRPLDKYGSSRVLLLGDSAHAMPVHLGNGAGQAIEDAYMLAHLINYSVKNRRYDIDRIVRVYSAVRQPFGNFAAKASLQQGRHYEFTTPEFDYVKEGDNLSPETLKRVAQNISDGWKWTWNSSIKPDLDRALAMMTFKTPISKL